MPENLKLYEQLRIQTAYKNVFYDDESGGMTATHISHKKSGKNEQKFFDGKLTGKELEHECAMTVCKKGGSCILENENIRINDSWKSCLDSRTNGKWMDIVSITQNGDNTVYNRICDKEKQLMKFNERTDIGAHSLMLYFHDPSMYSEDKIRNAIQRYVENIRYKHTITEVVCIVNDNTTDITVIKTKRPD